jgi:8-oxo-dGTP pyrophosphatase MutT (NUDIX family)
VVAADGGLAHRRARGGLSLHPRRAWPALLEARRTNASRRVPFALRGDDGFERRVGSVARAHAAELAGFEALRVTPRGVTLVAAGEERDAAWAEINRALHDAGLLLGWRDEPYAVRSAADGPVLAIVERAAARFFGLLTLAAHANGYVADASGRPTRLWIARRAATKATDPGRLDNLIGGGVPHGQTPFETLLREGFEEAGLDAAQVARAVPGAVIELRRDVPEGLQHEWLYVHDLRLAPDVVPANRDGEVAGFACHPIDEALAIAASGEMTVDAELVTLDFALRHRLLDAQAMAPLRARLDALCRSA